jgi:hypothetical protein
MLKPKGPFCQSCGMPLSKDLKGGGTEADGSITKEYCSHCYQLGKFTEPDMTVDQMVKKVQNKMSEMYIPTVFSRFFTKDIPSLKRWQKQI